MKGQFKNFSNSVLKIKGRISAVLWGHNNASQTINCINFKYLQGTLWLKITLSLLFSHSARLFATPWTTALQASLSIANSRACSNPCPLSQRCHPTISSSVIPFSSCLQSFPASGSFPMSWLFASGGQSVGASASVSVLPMNFQDWFPLGLTGLISMLSKGLSRVSPAPQLKSINFLALNFIHYPTLTSIHDYWKNHSHD